MQKDYFGGDSRENGFTIELNGKEYFKIGDPLKVNEHREKYHFDTLIAEVTKLSLSAAIFLVSLLFLLTLGNLTASLIAANIGAGVVSFFVGFFFFVLFRRISPENRQWHSLEHKMIKLLKNRKQVTLENLKNTKPYLLYCGSTSVCLFLASLATLSINLFSRFYFSRETSLVITFSSLCATVIMLPVLFQKYRAYKEPTKEQYEEVLKSWEEKDFQAKKQYEEILPLWEEKTFK